VVVKIIQHIVKTFSEMLIWREHQHNPICNSCLRTYIKLKLKVHMSIPRVCGLNIKFLIFAIVVKLTLRYV